MGDGNSQANFVGEGLQPHLPGVATIAIRPTTIYFNQ
jgi:hypothetical protein